MKKMRRNFFFLFGFSFKHDLCIFHCSVELVDFRYPAFASSNFLSVPTFGFIYTLKSMDWYWFSSCRLPIGVLKVFLWNLLRLPRGKGFNEC